MYMYVKTKMVSSLRFYLQSKCTATPILLWAPRDLLGCLSRELQIKNYYQVTKNIQIHHLSW